MKNLSSALLVVLLLPCMVLAQTLAPVNPDYIDYLISLEAGGFDRAAESEEGYKLGEIPAPVKPNFDALLSMPVDKSGSTENNPDHGLFS